jgi:serine/threonine protein kinase
MFDCVRALHHYGIIHRDLTPRHFLWDKPPSVPRLFLIDFGFSLLTNGEPIHRLPFAGSSRYAPTLVLAELKRQQQRQQQQQPQQQLGYHHSPLLQHDVESLVKVCVARFHPSVKSALHVINSTDFTALHDFWNAEENMMKESKSSWETALECARRDDIRGAEAAVLQVVYRNLSARSA